MPKRTAYPDGVEDEGAFAFATCPVCAWRGPGRRSRERARKDLKRHVADTEHPASAVDGTAYREM
jgi:hypothetical protein